MDQSNIVVIKVRALEIPRLEVMTNESKRYVVNLDELKSVHCYPTSQHEWEKVGITASGFNLTWGTGFEIHVHQAIDLAESAESIKRQA